VEGREGGDGDIDVDVDVWRERILEGSEKSSWAYDSASIDCGDTGREFLHSNVLMPATGFACERRGMAQRRRG
jgi:hypothetical protein